jgi:hypothetical protein
VNRPADLQRFGLGPGHVEKDPQVAVGRLQSFPGIHELDLCGLVERFDPAHLGDGARPFLVHPPRPVEENAEPLTGSLGEPDRLTRPEHVAERRVKVVDLEPDRILILRLQHPLRPACDDSSRLTLVGHVEWVGNVDVVLERAPGALG